VKKSIQTLLEALSDGTSHFAAHQRIFTAANC
jgi:hypothetical protein